MKILFVGGIADGEWLDIPEGAGFYEIPVFPEENSNDFIDKSSPEQPLKFRKEIYKKQVLSDKTPYGIGKYYVMYYQADAAGIIGQLISGYRKTRRTDE